MTTMQNSVQKQHWSFVVVCGMTKQMPSAVHGETAIVYLGYINLSDNTIKLQLCVKLHKS